MKRFVGLCPIAVLALVTTLAHADQGSFTNSGGQGSGGAGVYISSTVANPAGSLVLNCPTVSASVCAGGNFSFSSNDGTVVINASFTNGKYAESCAGGGKGGHISCSFSFSGSFSGALTTNGQTQAITGFTSQDFGVTTTYVNGITVYNSAYAPFYYSDSEQILRSDDLQGTNQISYGTQGSGVGQFYGAYGIALDSAGRIYVADTYNCRLVRIDDMNGTNWASYGGDCGSGQGQFYDPSGIAIDSAGKIYVLDTGNSRVVRIDDMTGANWIAYGSVGSGSGQFAQYITSLAVDRSSRVYVADTGNKRIVRIDDMTGTNWTALTQGTTSTGLNYALQSPAAVAVDPTGRIYIADNESYQPAVVRVDDITGANYTYLWVGSGGGLNSIALDNSGAVFAGGGGARVVVNMSGVLTSSGSIGPYGSYYVFGIAPIPLGNPRPSAIGFAPAALNFSQNVGTTGSLPLIVSNFGGSPLNVGTISVTGGFSQTNNCPAQLNAASFCTVTVSFTPSATGDIAGTLTVTDNAGNVISPQTVAILGTGTIPVATFTPASLNFSSTVEGTASTARNVVLQNTGTGPMQVTSVMVTGPYSQTNNCTSLAPGFSCTIAVTFAPVTIGSAPGSLSVTDSAGTQPVALSGSGSVPVSASPASVSFGSVAVGGTSANQSVTLTNRQKVALNVTGVAVTAGFAITTNTCSGSIAAGASCAVGVTFTPAALGAVTGTLTFADDALNTPQTVALNGTGSAPVTLSVSSLSFSSVVVGATSAAKTVTLSNRQSVALNMSGVTASAGFAIASNTCAGQVAAGASCSVGVTFSPVSAGSATGTLTLADDAGNSPQTVSLTGSGTAPVSVSSSSISFGNVTVGTTSSSRSVTLSNHMSSAVAISGVTVTAGFAIATNTCGTSVAAGASCTVGVTFSPTAIGLASGSLTFSDAAVNSPQVVTLSGNGSTGHNN